MSTQLESAFQGVLSEKNGNPDWLRDLRKKSFDQFSRNGFPSRSDEDWKYTSTRSLQETAFRLPRAELSTHPSIESFTLEGSRRLVFVNGVYQEKLSHPPSDVEIISFAKASVDDLELVRSHLTSEDSLRQLNQAFFSNGSLIKVKKGSEIAEPIQLLYLQNHSEEAEMISPRNIIVLGAHAKARFLESHRGTSAHFTNAVCDVHLHDGANCQFILEKILAEEAKFVGSHSFHLGRDANVETFNLAIGGQLNRSQLTFHLHGEGSFAKLDGLYLANDGNHIDNVTEVKHLAPHTSSAQLYKGILEGKSRAVFNGKITIVKDAQKVDAQQLNKNLLLSVDAEVDSRPQLVIDANDVKCSHGATIGQIDAQELFYLQSRAISRDTAKLMLAKAFIRDVLGRIEGEAMRSHLEGAIENFGSRK